MFVKALTLITCCWFLKSLGVWNWLVCLIAVLGVLRILDFTELFKDWLD